MSQTPTIPMVPIYGYPAKILYDEQGKPFLAVTITRAKDIEYAKNVTLETHLAETQALLTATQAQLADAVAHIQDMSTFLTERFGYQYGNHSAADAFVPLFENVDKVPSSPTGNGTTEG